MIEKMMVADLGAGDHATVNSRGEFCLTLNGRTNFMSEREARRLWSNLGTLLRESAKWNG
ncbi:hypothetical protein BSP239C_03199 [Brevibacterium sp. 239c]|uniref:hypothetical protein n=1 Tax=Brevibacterium sp. 239c TaxID=1965356 RepID=UPI000C62F258|nr:hypothetical protein [Brevibacterium sp. 239c]SMY01222.1 hypothetical protein BSP239C_03199 [Brevibacterium sp. 239c]